VDLTLFGRGGHGAKPHTTVDPVVLAARTVLALQTLVSREKDPLEPAVISVGSIHGGTKHNIIPDEVKLQITVRAFSPAVRKQLLDGIARIAKAEAASANAPREPEIKASESQDATYNDPALARRLEAALPQGLGKANVVEGKPEMVAEDFGELGKAAGGAVGPHPGRCHRTEEARRRDRLRHSAAVASLRDLRPRPRADDPHRHLGPGARGPRAAPREVRSSGATQSTRSTTSSPPHSLG
jgi:amidohydrolase